MKAKVICSECKKIISVIEDSRDGIDSHGFCKMCYKRSLRRIERQIANYKILHEMKENEGLLICKRISNADDLKQFVELCCHNGLLRCTSPERDDLCENPASVVRWIDIEEYYPCCKYHDIGPPEWIGNTTFHGPRKVELPAIPGPVKKWYDGISPEQSEKIKFERYKRENNKIQTTTFKEDE